MFLDFRAYLKSIPNQEKKNKKVLILGQWSCTSIILALLKSKIQILLLVRTYEKSLFLKKI